MRCTWLALLALVPALACGGSDGKTDPGTGGDVTILDTQFPTDATEAGEIGPEEDVVATDGTAETAPDVPCDFKTSANGIRNNCDGTVSDLDTGLIWQVGTGWASTYDQAVQTCKDLVLGTGVTWRLPTIDEMRGMVLGCPATAFGGACQVSVANWQEASYSTVCDGCEVGTGPGVEGAFIDEAFGKQSTTFWSSTKVKAKYVGDKRAWYVQYWNAAVGVSPSMDTQNFQVRCVAP